MKIVNSEPFYQTEHIQKKEVISFIVRLIFSISEINKSFVNTKKLQEQDDSILKAREKISKQNEFLSKISSAKESLSKKMSLLGNENTGTKSKLLTRLRVEQ